MPLYIPPLHTPEWEQLTMRRWEREKWLKAIKFFFCFSRESHLRQQGKMVMIEMSCGESETASNWKIVYTIALGMLRTNFSLKCISICRTCLMSKTFSLCFKPKNFSKVVILMMIWSIITSYNKFVAHLSHHHESHKNFTADNFILFWGYATGRNLS